MSERYAVRDPSSSEDLRCRIWKPGSERAVEFLLAISGVESDATVDQAIAQIEPIKLPPEELESLEPWARKIYDFTEDVINGPTYGGRRARSAS